ncbi:lipopolysaccharide biosynthesis protein [Micromonospora sp. URMC 105]|uniref:lipopolysaccharide biosynthesis protein n=1 Tax=Micromonospora sp. URMC 105 TaxID=3423413 RepID=UPI003F1DB488
MRKKLLALSERGVPGRRSKIGRSVRDASILAVTQYGQFLVTLLSVPFMARALGTSGLGYAAVATSAYFIGSVLVDFGLSFPLAAQLVARGDRGSVLRRRYSRLRVTIFAGIVVLAVATHLLTTSFGLRMAVLGLCAGGASSLPDTWILMARGQFWRFALSEWSGRLAYVGLLVVGISGHPSPTWVPASLLLGSLTNAAVSRGLVYWGCKRQDTDAPSLTVREMVALGAPALTGRILSTAYSQGAPLFYAVALNAASVGIFSASDRVVRAAQALSYPMTVALFPRLSTEQRNVALLASKARRYAMLASTLAMVGSGLLILLAPLVCNLLYGPSYSDAIDIMRIQALLLPFAVANAMLATNFFNIVGDTKATLITTVFGLIVTLLSLICAQFTQSLHVLAAGSVLAEVVVLALSWARITSSVGIAAVGEHGSDAPSARVVDDEPAQSGRWSR